MTESEAIKNLKDILDECTESEEAVCYVTDVNAPSLEMAINALEKQMPKKPEFEGMDMQTENWYTIMQNALYVDTILNME